MARRLIIAAVLLTCASIIASNLYLASTLRASTRPRRADTIESLHRSLRAYLADSSVRIAPGELREDLQNLRRTDTTQLTPDQAERFTALSIDIEAIIRLSDLIATKPIRDLDDPIANLLTTLAVPTIEVISEKDPKAGVPSIDLRKVRTILVNRSQAKATKLLAATPQP